MGAFSFSRFRDGAIYTHCPTGLRVEGSWLFCYSVNLRTARYFFFFSCLSEGSKFTVSEDWALLCVNVCVCARVREKENARRCAAFCQIWCPITCAFDNMNTNYLVDMWIDMYTCHVMLRTGNEGALTWIYAGFIIGGINLTFEYSVSNMKFDVKNSWKVNVFLIFKFLIIASFLQYESKYRGCCI